MPSKPPSPTTVQKTNSSSVPRFPRETKEPVMIDTFDSRALRVTDCYGQRFMKPGTYRYNVVPAHGHGITEERPFSIEVKERSAQPKMSQKSVVVTAEGGRFTVQPDVLTI